MNVYFKSVSILISCSIAASVIFFQASCRKDKCKDVVCENDGICDGGVCWCATGYEGDNCETLSIQKFIGPWVAQGSGTAGESTTEYHITISAGNQPNKVLISNFNNSFTLPVVAYAYKDSLKIPLQALQARYIVGTGYYADSTDLRLQYSITDSLTNLTTSYATSCHL